jgi:hypothetical protein
MQRLDENLLLNKLISAHGKYSNTGWLCVIFFSCRVSILQNKQHSSFFFLQKESINKIKMSLKDYI